MLILGFMTGTSLDGIDVALLDTDGDTLSGFGPHAEYPMPTITRDAIEVAIKDALTWDGQGAEPHSFTAARAAITTLHHQATERFLSENNLSIDAIDAIGVHGQTVYHQRPKDGQVGRTIQLFDPLNFARLTNKTIVSDFRSDDVKLGGEGAPLAPVYHRALVRHAKIDGNVVVVNLGGVANITLITEQDSLIAFDTGPGNGLMDQLMRYHNAGDFDQDGLIAASGGVDHTILANYMGHDYFKTAGPKSLDRYDFTIDPVKSLSLADGLATLCAFTVESLLHGINATSIKPDAVVLAGGGRMNKHLCATIESRLGGVLKQAEDLNWRGGAIEAEAFAYMAGRRINNLPISYPKTTGVPHPMTGGVITKP